MKCFLSWRWKTVERNTKIKCLSDLKDNEFTRLTRLCSGVNYTHQVVMFFAAEFSLWHRQSWLMLQSTGKREATAVSSSVVPRSYYKHIQYCVNLHFMIMLSNIILGNSRGCKIRSLHPSPRSSREGKFYEAFYGCFSVFLVSLRLFSPK